MIGGSKGTVWVLKHFCAISGSQHIDNANLSLVSLTCHKEPAKGQDNGGGGDAGHCFDQKGIYGCQGQVLDFMKLTTLGCNSFKLE